MNIVDIKSNEKGSCEWEVFQEERQFSISGKELPPYKVTGIRRADGFALILETLTKGKMEHFLCKGAFGEFKFRAVRWDTCNEKPTDKYIVILVLSTPEDQRFCRKFSIDIESALLHFPTSRIYEFIPVKEVLFDISIGSNPPRLISANEVAI